MPPEDTPRLTEAGRERIKLRANFLNGIAIATFAVGTLGALSKAHLEMSADVWVIAVGVAFAAVCLLVSGILHFVAYRHLKELDR
jgi:hypothetical protein